MEKRYQYYSVNIVLWLVMKKKVLLCAFHHVFSIVMLFCVHLCLSHTSLKS